MAMALGAVWEMKLSKCQPRFVVSGPDCVMFRSCSLLRWKNATLHLGMRIASGAVVAENLVLNPSVCEHM